MLNYLILYYMPVQKSLFLYFNLFTNGVCYSILTCALFSSVALSIPKAGVSMGYSILTLVENVGLSTLPLYFGHISKDRSVDSYNKCILSLILLSFLSVIVCSILFMYDTKKTKLLTLPENSKKVKRIRQSIDTDFHEKSMRDTSLSMSMIKKTQAAKSFS